MNKTVNINLGGIFFHIDEVAYQKLKRYIDAIRRSLSDDPKGRDEIISDIELRIGELLSQRVKDVRQVVSESDIDEVIAVMGQPEDYLVDEELFTEETKRSYSSSSNRRKSSGKKLFRDGDDKFLGGVSSGIAYYFDVDVIWIRIAWLVATFGLGFGPILYIVLWILLPEAKTTADKLQMEGEPVNISNIEKRVRSEFEDASARVRDAANEVSAKVKEGMDSVSDSLKKKRVSSSGAKSGIQELIEVIGTIVVTFFKIIGKFIGIVLVIAAIIALIALVISLFTAGAVGFMGIDSLFNEGIQVMNPTSIPTWVISLILLILIGIPFLMLFFLGLFIISSESKKVISRTGKFVLLGVWIMALLSAIYIGLRQGAEFARQGTVTETTSINLQEVDTLTITMSDITNFEGGEDIRRKFGMRYVYDENDNERFFYTDVRFDVKVSDSTETYVKVRKKAQGRSRDLAKENASMIDYDFKLSDNTLILNEYFLTDTKFPFRDQELLVTIYIPKGKVVNFDESTKRFIKYNTRTTNDMYSRDMAGQKFIMTDDGLKCLDCIINEDGWKYEDNSDPDNEDDENNGVKLKVDENGIELKINDNGENAKVKLDENGLKIS